MMPDEPQTGLKNSVAGTMAHPLFQINFFQGHTKLILCPLMAAVTYVDNNRAFYMHLLEILHNGCPPRSLRLAPHAETGGQRDRCKRLLGTLSLMVNAAACRRRARLSLCEGMPERLCSRI
ncbi:hypothetical protein MTO96_045948 [Rhipicephalus appendiculatus]